MGARCSDLAEYDNPCEVMQCVDAVKVLPLGQSASASFQAVLTMKPGTNYQGVPVRQAFLKCFVNVYHERQPTQFPEPIYRDNSVSWKGLYYELVMNMSVIQPLISQRICPFFLQVYNGSFNCSYDNVLQVAPRQTVIQSVYRKGAPPATEDLSWLQSSKFCFMVSEAVSAPTLRTWFQAANRSAKDKYMVLFQIAYACFIMEQAHIAHNDLHDDNVFVKTEAAPVTYTLVVPTTPPTYYQFTTRYRALLFDFDQSNTQLYNNPSVDAFVALEHAEALQKGKRAPPELFHTLNIVPTRDFFQVVQSTRWLEAGLLLVPPSAKPLLTPRFHPRFDIRISFPLALLRVLKPLSEVLPELARRAGVTRSTELPPNASTTNLWGVVNKSLFLPRGHVGTTSIRDFLLQPLQSKTYYQNEKDIYSYDYLQQ